MRTCFFLLLLGAGGVLGRPAQAQVSRFHGDLGGGLVPLRSTAPGQANPNNSSNIPSGYVLQTVNVNLLSLHGNLGFDAPLYPFGGNEQSLGVALNAGAGLLATSREEAAGFNTRLVLDFPEYVTYRYGAKASKHSKKDFGVGVGLGYRFCRFFLPFNAPSAMLEGVYAATDADWFLRLSADLRPTRFYNDYSSEGLVEALRIRAFTATIGKSF